MVKVDRHGLEGGLCWFKKKKKLGVSVVALW